jgi:hypothetical protein
LYFVALVDRGVGTGRLGGHLVFEHLALLEENPFVVLDGRQPQRPAITGTEDHLGQIGWAGNFIR